MWCLRSIAFLVGRFVIFLANGLRADRWMSYDLSKKHKGKNVESLFIVCFVWIFSAVSSGRVFPHLLLFGEIWNRWHNLILFLPFYRSVWWSDDTKRWAIHVEWICHFHSFFIHSSLVYIFRDFSYFAFISIIFYSTVNRWLCSVRPIIAHTHLLLR